MSISITGGIPANVVEVGNEISQDVIDGLNSANPSASSTNPFATLSNLSYLPLAGGTMSGPIVFDSVGTQNISKGSFDSSRGGYNGISLNCAVGYELNWQAGWLKGVQIGGGVVPINFESNINVEANGSKAFIDPTEVYTTRFDATGTNANAYGALYNGGVEVGDATGKWAELTPTRLKFGDGTTMSSAEQYLPINRNGDFNFFTAGNWSAFTSGATQNQDGWSKRIINLTTLGYGAYYYQPSYIQRQWGNAHYCSWDVKTDISFRAIISTNNNTTNDQIVRIGYGKNGNPYAIGDLTTKGVGIRRIGQGFIELMVHDGTTFRTVTSSYNNGNNSGGFDAKISLDGLGKVDLYVNGNIVATSNNAPLGISNVFCNYLFFENQTLSAVVSPAVSMQVVVAGFKLSTI